MKLKTLLSIMYHENIIHFIIQNEELEMLCEFRTTPNDKILNAYDDCWVAMVDMEERQIFVDI